MAGWLGQKAAGASRMSRGSLLHPQGLSHKGWDGCCSVSAQPPLPEPPLLPPKSLWAVGGPAGQMGLQFDK